MVEGGGDRGAWEEPDADASNTEFHYVNLGLCKLVKSLRNEYLGSEKEVTYTTAIVVQNLSICIRCPFNAAASVPVSAIIAVGRQDFPSLLTLDAHGTAVRRV